MKSYTIIDNGSTPFLVNVEKDTVHILRQVVLENDEVTYTQLMNLKYKDIYIGKDPKNFTKEMGEEWSRDLVGNSILLKTSDKNYVFIGWDIYSFELEDGDTVVKYYSPMGPNGVPYPVLIGKKKSYFMIEKQYASNDLFNLSNELYDQFYSLKKDHKYDMKNVKMIQERLW